MSTPTLPPYIYGREASANEKVWAESAVASLSRELEEVRSARDIAVELGATYAARLDLVSAERDALRVEADRYRWLAPRLVGYECAGDGDSGPALIFRWDGSPVTLNEAGLSKAIDAATKGAPHA